jgi:hypothetical protein
MANILPLVATGAMNNYFPIKYSISTDIIHCTSRQLQNIPRTCDSFSIDGFILPNNIHLDNITNLEIQIGGSTVFTIPFSLIIYLSKIKEIDDKIYIKLNQSLLGHLNKESRQFEIPILNLQYNNIDFILQGTKTFNFDIIINNKYLQTQDRKQQLELSKTNIDIAINQYQKFPIHNVSTNINANHVSKGFFVKTLYPIISLELQLNGRLFKKYEKNMIIYNDLLRYKKLLWTQKHSLTLQFMFNKVFPPEITDMIEYYVRDRYEYLYWFDFNNNNFDSEKIYSTINFSRIDNCKINLFLEKSDYTNTELIFMNKNLLRLLNGLGATIFA